MKGFRTAFHYSQITLQDSLHNISTYITLASLFLVVQYYCPEIGRYLAENGDRLNLWELYIWSMSTRPSQLLYLAGVIGTTCQLMQLRNGTAFYLARMKRRTWVRAQTLTLFFHILGLNIFLLLSFVIASRGQITLAGEWSRAALTGAQFGNSEIIGLQSILRISHSLLSFNPNTAGLLSLLLAILLGMAMGLTMMVFTLCHNAAFGGMVIFILWFLDVLAESIPLFQILRYILPFGLARISYTTWNYGIVTPGYCIIFLLVLTTLFVWINDWACDRADFVKMG